MTPEQIEDFLIKERHGITLVNEFNQELKENIKRVFEMILRPFKISPGCPFLDFDNSQFVPSEVVVNHILAQEVLSIRNFPEWYRHRLKHDINEALNFKANKKVPTLIFSLPAPMNNKRKAEDYAADKPRHSDKSKVFR